MAGRKVKRKSKGSGSKGRYKPEWKGPIEGYVKNYLAKNYWRVQHLYTYEEAVNHIGTIFSELAMKYAYVDTPQWFMALFKRTLSRRFINLSKKDTCRQSEITFSDLLGDDGSEETLHRGVDYNYGMLLIMIEEAPEEVRSVINLMIECPREVMDMLIAQWTPSGHRGTYQNRFLCEMLGKDPDQIDLVKLCRDYFTY